jgi:hypothetical protein
MKSLIKKLLKESLLSEKLADIDDDVNLLYNKFFKTDIDEVEKTGVITDKMFFYNETNSIILKSPDCIKANEKNPCIIEVNNGSNYYSPTKKIISISVSSNASDFVKNEGGDIKLATKFLNQQQQQSLLKEFTEERIKGSIHHELAHWIDDTLHNRHITKRINKATEIGSRDLGGIPVNATKMEIQGQIHNVKQLYNKHNKIWDELSFNEMLNLSPSLILISNQLKNNYKKQWVRDLKTRMHREGLLGKNMYNN